VEESHARRGPSCVAAAVGPRLQARGRGEAWLMAAARRERQAGVRRRCAPVEHVHGGRRCATSGFFRCDAVCSLFAPLVSHHPTEHAVGWHSGYATRVGKLPVRKKFVFKEKHSQNCSFYGCSTFLSSCNLIGGFSVRGKLGPN
jgi:hypothetical protein